MSRSQPLTNALHTAFGLVAVFSMLAAPFVFGRYAGDGERWRRYRRASIVVGVVVIALLIVSLPLAAVPLGVGQRIGFGIWYIWLVALAFRLYRDQSPR